MTTTTATPITSSSTPETDHTGRVTWKNGLATSVVAALVVTGVAATYRAAGHQLGAGGAIPLLGFAQFVLIFAVLGIVIARHTSRVTFLQVAAVLTVLSFLPDLLLGDGVVSKLGLMSTHAVAAAILVPRLARR